YMCLSHCWGKKPFIQTTKSNVASFQSGIPWNLLPRTFRDAINLAHRIGVTYIWIDSLCIIQDDEDDWRKEGSQMADIYRGSFLTIAATKAFDSSQGLYTDTTCHRSVSMNYNKLSPLLSRAWVFQERILSRRLVHFASTELWWECMESTTCECCRISGGIYSGHDKKHLNVEEEFDEASVGETWRYLVTDYSFKQLTYQKDILPAIQGLAKRMYTTRRSEYLGGLWRDSLIKDLVWRRMMVGWYVDKVHPVNEFAPTWSWAA
ncbi:HET-domain-containing protein, partial [Lophiostoma macrostomum CBS 122681]